MADLHNEMIPYTPEELITIGEREFAWCEAEMKKASNEMGFGDDWHKAVEKVKRAFVTARESLRGSGKFQTRNGSLKAGTTPSNVHGSALPYQKMYLSGANPSKRATIQLSAAARTVDSRSHGVSWPGFFLFSSG